MCGGGGRPVDPGESVTRTLGPGEADMVGLGLGEHAPTWGAPRPRHPVLSSGFSGHRGVTPMAVSPGRERVSLWHHGAMPVPHPGQAAPGGGRSPARRGFKAGPRELC